MKRMRIKNNLLSTQQGVTLIEILISVMIFSIISLALYAILLAGQQSFNATEIQVKHQQELRKSMEAMIYDLRQAGDSSITGVDADDAPHTSITFQIPQTVINGSIVWNPNSITYALNGTNLEKTQAGVTQVISQDIRSLQFQRNSADPDILNVSVTVGTVLITPAEFATDYSSIYANLEDVKKTELTLNFEVQLRN